MVDRFDVCVVGGGPAGLAAALAARRRGMSALVADGNCPPIDKACGEGLMPEGQAALARLGVSLPAEICQPFRGIRFVEGARSVYADFKSGSGVGIRRTALHVWMVEECKRAGVAFRWGSPVTSIETTGVQTGDSRVRARWIVGADGHRSMERRWAGLDRFLSDSVRYAYRRHYAVPSWTGYMELHWGPQCQVYVTPIAPNEICVALISREQGLRIDEALARFPGLAERLGAAKPTNRERGAITLMRRLRRVHSRNVALVGDASGAVDAITGQGLYLAFRQADELMGCLSRDQIHQYQACHDRIDRRPRSMARALLLLDQRSGLRRRTLEVFADRPALFASMLNGHAGEGSLWSMAANGAALGIGLARTLAA